MAKKNRKRLIIIQKGKNKYSASKMQGAAIKMYVIDRYIECEKIKEIAENIPRGKNDKKSFPGDFFIYCGKVCLIRREIWISEKNISGQ